jgi:hypothetical protein
MEGSLLYYAIFIFSGGWCTQELRKQLEMDLDGGTAKILHDLFLF